MIRDYGLEPDETKTNPHYITAAPMKLYDLNKVERIESGAWFREHLAASRTRKNAAKKAVKTKHDRMMTYIESLPIRLPDWSKEEAFTKAVIHYNSLWARKGREDKYISDYRTLDAEMLERITQNMFRHSCTNYDDVLYQCYGKVGVETAHTYLYSKINDMVHEKYFAVQPISEYGASETRK